METLKKQIGGNHYKKYDYEPLKFFTDTNIPFALGNAVKYVLRCQDKNGFEDLQKAIHNLEFLIEKMNLSMDFDKILNLWTYDNRYKKQRFLNNKFYSDESKNIIQHILNIEFNKAIELIKKEML